MQVVYRQFKIYNSDGSVAGTLDGVYEASPAGGQAGWHALRKVRDDGTVDDEIVANVHIVGGSTVA